MKSENLEKKCEDAKIERKQAKDDCVYYIQEEKKFGQAQTGVRMGVRLLFMPVPYVLTTLACVGLMKHGLMNPNLAGPVCVGLPFALASKVEDKCTRKIVDARTLSADNAYSLRRYVFNRIKSFEAVGKLGETSEYISKVTNEKALDKELSKDLYELNDELTTLDKAIDSQEKTIESAAIKVSLVNDLKGYKSYLSVFRNIGKGAVLSAMMTAAYNLPLAAAGLPISGLQIAIPAALTFAIAGPYQLATNHEMRKLYKKYDGLMAQDVDVKNVKDVFECGETLGTLKATRDICQEAIDSKVRVKKQ